MFGNVDNFMSQFSGNEYVPIRRQNYQWLIDSSFEQQTQQRTTLFSSNNQRDIGLLSTPHRPAKLQQSFNSSSFSESNYRSPLDPSPHLATTFTKNKRRRLMKHAYIEQNQCSICLEVIREQVDLPCSHSYCYGCVEQWFKNATKCPYCRSDVSFFTFRGEKIKVEPKIFQYEPRNDEIMDWLCYKCDHTQQGDIILICDRCEAYACHIECDEGLNGVEPEGEWYCHYCR